MLSARTATHLLKTSGLRASGVKLLPTLSTLTTHSRALTNFPGGSGSVFGSSGSSYFRRERMPANTIIRFVPRHTPSPQPR